MNSLDNTGNREIRIFLSSTFSDMQEERNYLTKKIFPRITEICEKRQIRFSVLDLRWGITEEESRTGKVIEICMDEIKRTKPYFIGLLGGRYGWIPTEEETVRNRHLTEKYPWIPEYMKAGCSITEIEMQFAALKETENIEAFFFLRDMDSVPARFREKEGSPEMEKLGQLRSKVLEQSSKGRCTADTYRDMSGLGRVVQERLLAMIDSRFPESENPDSASAILHRQAFKRARLRSNYVDNGAKRRSKMESMFRSASAIFVTGEKGMGKSALLANWHPEDKVREEDGTEWKIVRTDIDDTVNSIPSITEIFKDQLKLIDASLPDLDGETETSLPDFVKKCSMNVVWVIDGLEKMPAGSMENFSFLFSLPENVKPVIAGDTDFIKRISGYAKGDARTVKVWPLEENEIIRVLKDRLAECGKSLTEKQEVHIMSATILSNPSLLQLFIEELIQFGIHEQLDGFIDRFVSAGNREEFISRVLDVIEEDFGTSMAGKILGLLACTEYGMDEKIMTDELRLGPLDWSAIYSAVESLVSRHDGLISIKEDYVFRCIEERYLTGNDGAKDIRKAAIRILKKERKKQLRKLSASDRLLYRIYGINLGEEDTLRLDTISYGLARQYFAAGKKRKAIRIVAHDMASMLNSAMLGLKAHGLFHDAMAAGMSPSRFFSFPKMLRDSFFDNEGWMALAYVLIFREANPGIPDEILKNVKRMPLPKRYKENVCRMLESIKPQNASGNIEDTWEPGKEIHDLMQLGSFASGIPSILSMQRVRHIREQAEAVAVSLPENSLTWAYMKYMISFALVREGKPDEAEQVLLSTAEVTDPEKYKDLKFEIAFARKDYDGCRKILEDVKLLTAAIANAGIKWRRRVTELCMELAIEEKTSYHLSDSLLRDMAERLRGLYDESSQSNDNKKGYMRTIAYSLYIKKCFKAAAEAYGILLEVETDAASAAIEYGNFGDCLKEDKRYAEAAGAYMSAARYYAGKDIAGYLDKIYSVAENLIAAKKGAEAAAAVKTAFMEVRKAEDGLSPDGKADCWNRIIVMLYMTCGDSGTPEEPLEISCTSMKGILECSAEPDIRAISNFAHLLDRVSNLCPDRHKFREAFALLQPHVGTLLREKKKEFIGILPALAIIAGDRDTAARLLDTVEEKDDKYVEQSIMLDLASPDAEVRKNAMLCVVHNFNLDMDEARLASVRKHLINLLIKYNCLETLMEQCRESADKDSLFTLWDIASATSDMDTVAWCEDRLKRLAAESRSAEIPSGYVARQLVYSREAKPDYAALFMDWLGNAFSDIRNVVVFIDTVLRNTFGESGNSTWHTKYHKSRKETISAYIGSALEQTGDRTAYMESLIDAVNGLKFNDSTAAVDMITVSDALCSLYAEGKIPSSLKERLLNLLKAATDITARIKNDDDYATDPVRNFDNYRTRIAYLADIYDLYRLLDGPAPDDIVKAKLKCSAVKPAMMDSPFPEILVNEIERGYNPDTEVYALAFGFYISRNMTEEAEGILTLFAENVAGREEFLLSVELCRAILDVDKGEYAAASVGFSTTMAFDFGIGVGYRIFRNLFADFSEMTDINSLRTLAAISSIYAGYCSEGIERAGMISSRNYFDKEHHIYTEDLLVCLSMLRSGLYDDAMGYFREKFDAPVEDAWLPDGHERITQHLVAIETAKMYVAKGDIKNATRALHHAERMETPFSHPVCRAELAKAKAMFHELERQ